MLYALDRATGEVRWTFQADGPILSSPAVATGGAADIIVFGSDVLGTITGSPVPVPIDGRVYAVRDDGPTGTLLWTFEAGASIGASSPSINTDGTVYIGRAGQQLDTATVPPSPATATIRTPPARENAGGALYAIGAGAALAAN